MSWRDKEIRWGDIEKDSMLTFKNLLEEIESKFDSLINELEDMESKIEGLEAELDEVSENQC